MASTIYMKRKGKSVLLMDILSKIKEVPSGIVIRPPGESYENFFFKPQ